MPTALVNMLRHAVLLSVFIAPLAHAASKADDLLSQGVELRRQGNDAAALERFREANKLEPGPRALAQMGLAEQALGYWMVAGHHVRRALQSKDDPWIRKNQPALEQALTVIDSHLGQLSVTGTPEGAEVLVDGELVGTLPMAQPLRVSHGTVVVDVRANGYVPISRPLQISPGTHGREHFALQLVRPVNSTAVPEPPPAEPREVTPPAAKPEKATRGLRIVAWTSAAGATLALGWGIYEHLTLRERKSDYESGRCAITGSPTCDTLAEKGKTAQTLMFVGYGLAAVLTATSVISFITDKPPQDDRTALMCVPNFTAPGASCALRF